LTGCGKRCLLAHDPPLDAGAERVMRAALFGLIVCGAAAALGTPPAAAREYPFCIRGCDFGAGRGDCSFSSYQQCQATASGRDATCTENPYFSAKAELQPERSRQSHRRY
jgi:hypothetical protein